MADWKNVARAIAPIAPFAGKLLGGLLPFPGASLVLEGFGTVLARQFGVTTPQETAQAIANSDQATVVAKVNAAVEQSRVEVTGFVDLEKAYLHAVEVGLEQTGLTMRAELAATSEHWFYRAWRPAIGWVFVAFALSFGAMLSIAALAAAVADNSKPLAILTEAWTIFLAYFGVLGLMVGVYIPSRSTEKAKAIETGTPMPNAQPQKSPAATTRPVAPIKEPRT